MTNNNNNKVFARLIGDGRQNGAKENYRTFSSKSAAKKFAVKNGYSTVEVLYCGAYINI
jgi:hypothetical protein